MPEIVQRRLSELDLTGRSFLTIHDYSPAEVLSLLDLAGALKDAQKRRAPHRVLEGRAVAMIFMKTSTRTRMSFEVGIEQIGAQPMFLNANDIQLRVGETIKDTANVMSRYVDCIMIRTFAHKDVEDLAAYGQIPVINGLTDAHHPCQGMADAMTVREHCGDLAGKKLVFSGDGNNVAHSLADVIYTDTFTSMGQEAEHDARLAALEAYQVNMDLVRRAGAQVKVMHCLPAHWGEEITEEVLYSPHSVVFDQAENRLHAQKAIMAALIA
jgi:ornithine carbamoyltransferase